MLKHLLVVALVVGGAGSAVAQSNKGAGTTAVPGPSSNLNNPQAQANMAGQPANARTLPSSGDATKIPTPVINGHPSTSVPKAQGVPTSGVAR